MSSGASGRKESTLKDIKLRIAAGEIGRIIDRMGEGALLVDLSTRAVLRANEAFRRLAGFDPADLVALDLASLHDLKDLEWILQCASRPDGAGSVLRQVACLGRDRQPFTSDLKVVGIAEEGGTLALLTYDAPSAERGAGADAAAASAGRALLRSATDLASLTRALASARDREDLSRVLIEASAGLMGCERVLLLARRAAPPGTEILLSSGLEGEVVAAAHRWLDELLASVLLAPERPLVLEHRVGAGAPGGGCEDLARAGVGAVIVFPLESEGRVAGAWVLGYRDLSAARERDLVPGQAFAAHLSGTLAGVLLLERTRKEKSHQEVLNRIVSNLRGPFEMESFLDALTGELCAALDADRCLILVAARSDNDPGTVRVDFEHHRGEQVSLKTLGPIPFANTSLGQAVLFSKEPLVTDDLKLRPDLTEHHEALVEKLDLRGLVMAKIMSRQGFTGLVAVATSGKPRSWTEEEIALVRAVADHVSVTIETGRLIRANEDRARQLKLLTEVQQSVGRLRDVGALLQEAVEALCRSFGYRQARIATVPAEGEGTHGATLTEQARAGVEETAATGALRAGRGAEAGGEDLVHKAARTGRTEVAGDDEALFDDSGALQASEIAIPLLQADTLLGVLGVRSDRPGAFGEKARGVLETFADHLVMAIQNARLYEAERRRSRRMEILGALHSDDGPIGGPADMVRRAARSITEAYPEVSVRITGVEAAGVDEIVSGPAETLPGATSSSGAAGAGVPTARLTLPIRKGERELGLLHLRHRSAAAFDEGERRTFELLADRLAVALENAALFAQIERERREWERTFDAIPDMLSIHDGYGRLLRANLALQVRLGGDPRPYLGKECRELLETVAGPTAACPHFEALQSRRPLAREIQGERGAFSLMAIPCFDQAGNCLYIIHVAREISEEKQIREQLLQNEKMAAVGSLVSGVAHELNKPLAGVTGFAQILLERHSDPKLKASLERIR
ncbi:MAG TPA: GAF domain-containing protein, partial [Candidatus Polarisedimenticolia bacterium]|nr:GAF domain-containing protein [Candidatus Polarisedimenticolia bacterium]